MAKLKLGLAFVIAFILTILSLQIKSPVIAHTLIGNIGGKHLLNDDIGRFDAVNRSFLFYQNPRTELSAWQIQMIIAGLFNRIEADYLIQENLSVFGSHLNMFLIEGDSPRVEGQDFDQYEFKAHRYAWELGVRYAFPVGADRALLSSFYGYDFLDVYEKAEAPAFRSPSHIQEHSFNLVLRREKSQPVVELFDMGFYPLLAASYSYRPGFEGLGLPEKETHRHFSKFSAGTYWSQSFGRSLVWVSGIQGSFVQNSDRMNALRAVAFRTKSPDLFLGDVRSDRAISGEFGPRIYTDPRRHFAFRPFFFAAYYHEIFVDRRGKADAVYGPGIKLMGRVGQRFLYDLIYAAGFGNREDKTALHELRFNLSYRFMP